MIGFDFQAICLKHSFKFLFFIHQTRISNSTRIILFLNCVRLDGIVVVEDLLSSVLSVKPVPAAPRVGVLLGSHLVVPPVEVLGLL